MPKNTNNLSMNALLNYNGKAFNIFGRNADIDIAAAEDIWTPGGTKSWGTTADAMEILSNSAADTAAGTGARTVTIYGLDINYVERSETITLNGVTPVALVNTYLDIYRVVVITVGSGGVNTGTLTVRTVVGTVTVCTVPVHASLGGMSITQGTHFIVPAGQIGLLTNIFLSVSGTARANFSLNIRLSGYPKITTRMYNQVTGFVVINFEVPIKVSEMRQLWLSATVDTDNTEVTAGYDITIIRNN